MPLYEYQCTPHRHRFEVRHGYNEAPQQVCPSCGSTDVHRIIHPVGIVFKGSGFYATDSRASSSTSKPAEKSDKGEKADKADNTEKSESKAEPAKAEGKSDSTEKAS